MSVKHALLALLSRGPSTTFQLKKEFDHLTGGTWPLNIGQVSTTLQRLQRDGLATRDEDVLDENRSPDPWRLTDLGREAIAQWWHDPVRNEQRGRGELVIKLTCALVAPGVDVAALVQRQRSATQQMLHEITMAKNAMPLEDLASRLVLSNHIFVVEAELRWLDTVEVTIARAAATIKEVEAAQTPPEIIRPLTPKRSTNLTSGQTR